MEHNITNFMCLSSDPRAATKNVLEILRNEIHPFITKIRKKILFGSKSDEDAAKIRDVFTLCLSQMKKCLIHLFEVFRLEFHTHMILQETRLCNIEWISWCLKRLWAIDRYYNTTVDSSQSNDAGTDDSLNVTVTYFVDWIDHAIEVLGILAATVYKNDYKESEEKCLQWKIAVLECVSDLHLSIDELLLSVMTLSRYCLPTDQHIVKARCQVVLRETKALLSEVIEGDLSDTVEVTPNAIKLPIMPSNVNIMIDVLKDVLNALEINTKAGLLNLLIHCFSNIKSPIDVLKEHFIQSADGGCLCVNARETSSASVNAEDCTFVKEFDLYNERLMQFGSFAVLFSSDEHRILSLRSGLASLEALDSHLVPALMTSPYSYHSALLIKQWKQEVQEIRDSVFLIVDPDAFTDKSKQMMHQKLLEVLKDADYNNTNVCSVINMGCVVQDFFDIYTKFKLDVLNCCDKLFPLLADLNKVQLECKTVCNLLSSEEDFAYDVKMPKQKEATLDQLHKRLKLLYTLVSRINALIQPKSDELFENDEDVIENVTHTIMKDSQTFMTSPKMDHKSKSMFAGTNVKSSTRNFPLTKLTKNLRGKNCSALNFTVKLDQLFNLSNETVANKPYENKYLEKVRETSILYASPMKNRCSLRKVVLNRQFTTFEKSLENLSANNVAVDSLMDENESLQLTEMLNQMNDMTSITTTRREELLNQTETKTQAISKNVFSLNASNKNATISKRLRNINLNCSTVDMALDETVMTSNVSNVDTLERIHDLDFVETKLNSLKSQLETSL